MLWMCLMDPPTHVMSWMSGSAYTRNVMDMDPSPWIRLHT